MAKLVQLKNENKNVYPKTAISSHILIARRNSNQVVQSGAIQFPIIERESNYFSITNNYSKFIAKKKMVVLIIGNINFYSFAANNFFVRVAIYKNGYDIGNRIPANKVVNWQPIHISGIVELDVDDYIEIVSVSDSSVEIAANNYDGTYINIIPIL